VSILDSTTQFAIMAGLTIVTIITSVFFYIQQRQRKTLSCEHISITPLLSIEDEIKSDLVIEYKGKRVQQVHLAMYRISNSGNIPIKTEDYEGRPLKLAFSDKTQILSSEIIEQDPPNLKISVRVHGNSIFLDPVLLNGGDNFVIKSLITNYERSPELDGRIVGVRKIIMKHTNLDRRYTIIAFSGLLIQVLFLVLNLINYWDIFLIGSFIGAGIGLYGAFKGIGLHRKK